MFELKEGPVKKGGLNRTSITQRSTEAPKAQSKKKQLTIKSLTIILKNIFKNNKDLAAEFYHIDFENHFAKELLEAFKEENYI